MKIKQSLYTDWKEDIITFDDYKNYSSSYNTKIEELKEMLNTINNEITEYETIPDNNDELNNIFNESNLINELDRNILFRMIEQIIIYEDKKVEISFKYQDIYNDIRKYIPGDRLSDVHWKNYARTGEMYVRTPEKQEIDILCIAAVTEALDGSIEMMEQRDSFLEYLVSVGNYFGMNNKPLVIYYYNAGVQSYLIDSPVSFREFYSNVPDRVGQKTAAGHEKEILEVASNSFTSIILFLEDGCVFKKAYDDQQ